ncbi:MAG: BREX-1 system phosphatase PglZ type B [Polyangiales bacterium]
MTETVLDALIAALDQYRQYARASEEAPLLILWPDRDRQWEAVAPLLRARIPQLVTVGERDSATRTGPAIWVRCALARSVDVDWPDHLPPVVYLPGVAREELRAVDECAPSLAPLAGLQYRGRIWAQENARDWTVRAFLTTTSGGLGLDVAEDRDTSEAMLLALREVAETPVESLRGRRLVGADFRKLLVDDPVREFLEWLDDPDGFVKRHDPARWTALQKVCAQTWQINLKSDGASVAAEKLCAADGAWLSLWRRFSENVTKYHRVFQRLQGVAPPAQMTLDARERYPSVNASMEDELRVALVALKNEPAPDARRKVLELEARHGLRRRWAWASIPTGGAALAGALEHLAKIARDTERPLPGDSPDAMAQAWTNAGWEVDLAALRACAAVQREADLGAVHGALRAVYGPWLNESAQRFQQLVVAYGFPGYSDEAKQPLTVGHGEVLFFADGLRYDVSRWLIDELVARGLTVSMGTRWIGMPSVTATSKHAASPVVAMLTGSETGKDFAPIVKATGKPVVAEAFRKLLSEVGYQVLTESAEGDTSGRGYMEYGDLDHDGHAVQSRLASHVREHVDALADRIVALLEKGWKRLRVVTDHGWVLLPGGLPKSPLDASVTEDKWGRCAVLKSTAQSAAGLATLPWRWSPAVTIVAAPGVAVFYAGSDYAHGGLSLHECLTPDLWVSRGKANALPSGIAVTWKSMRCAVKIASGFEGLRVDVRAKANDGATSLISAVKPFGGDGSVSVLVSDHELAGTAAYLVLLDGDGGVVHSQMLSIGG